MTEDQKNPAGPEAVPPVESAAKEESAPAPLPKSTPAFAAGAVAAPEPRYPALLESLAALGLLLVVAYSCWRLYGIEIGRMFAALFGK